MDRPQEAGGKLAARRRPSGEQRPWEASRPLREAAQIDRNLATPHKLLPKQQIECPQRRRPATQARGTYLLLLSLAAALAASVQAQQATSASSSGSAVERKSLPDLTSATSEEPLAAVIGQDAFISCVAKNLQNYTIIWRFTNDANAPAEFESADASRQQQQPSSSLKPSETELGTILTAGRQRVTPDERISVIQSHDTWLLKISNVRPSDTGTYICHTNSEPRVRVARILSVIKPSQSQQSSELTGEFPLKLVRHLRGVIIGAPCAQISDLLTDRTFLCLANNCADSLSAHFNSIDYNFTDCCKSEYVVPRCQRLCSFQQLASRYQSINLVHECYSNLPSITRCMVAGRNVTDCCQKRHIPSKCKPMCGHQGDTSAMSVQDQSYCADYSAAIMSCK